MFTCDVGHLASMKEESRPREIVTSKGSHRACLAERKLCKAQEGMLVALTARCELHLKTLRCESVSFLEVLLQFPLSMQNFFLAIFLAQILTHF